MVDQDEEFHICYHKIQECRVMESDTPEEAKRKQIVKTNLSRRYMIKYPHDKDMYIDEMLVSQRYESIERTVKNIITMCRMGLSVGVYCNIDTFLRYLSFNKLKLILNEAKHLTPLSDQLHEYIISDQASGYNNNFMAYRDYLDFRIKFPDATTDEAYIVCLQETRVRFDFFRFEIIRLSYDIHMDITMDNLHKLEYIISTAVEFRERRTRNEVPGFVSLDVSYTEPISDICQKVSGVLTSFNRLEEALMWLLLGNTKTDERLDIKMLILLFQILVSETQIVIEPMEIRFFSSPQQRSYNKIREIMQVYKDEEFDLTEAITSAVYYFETADPNKLLNRLNTIASNAQELELLRDEMGENNHYDELVIIITNLGEILNKAADNYNLFYSDIIVKNNL